MKKLIVLCLMLPLFAVSQEQLEGVVLEASSAKESPLPGANVYWANSTVGTITNEDGSFTLPYKFSYSKLVISYVGFKTDTITVTENKYIKHVLQASDDLDAVTVTSSKKATSRS